MINLEQFLKIPTGQKFTESRMLSKLRTCSLIYSEMPLQNAFQCAIGGQQIIVNPNGGILTSEIFYKPRNVLIGDTNQHIVRQIN